MLNAMVDDVQPYLPAGVATVRVRLTCTNGFQVWAVPTVVPESAAYEFIEVLLNEGGGSLQSRGPEPLFGLRRVSTGIRGSACTNRCD